MLLLFQVDEVAGILGLEGAKNTQVKYLSGGEKKRLSIDVELMNNPPVLFFDEPIRYFILLLALFF